MVFVEKMFWFSIFKRYTLDIDIYVYEKLCWMKNKLYDIDIIQKCDFQLLMHSVRVNLLF